MSQYYIDSRHYEEEIELLLQHLKVRHILLVCGKSFHRLHIGNFIEKLQQDRKVMITYFEDFSPNPKYEDILQGVKLFCTSGCDFIMAVGGGSAIDVAKCIKLFARLNKDEDYLKQEITVNDITLAAIPTTAGTGSEATQFAVLYVSGNKYVVEHVSALPQYVLLYPDNLTTLSDYQKRVTLCDALAHAVESYWSLNSSKESRRLSETVIHLILDHMERYLENDKSTFKQMMLASNLAGQAINMTKTTAAHAMSYKLTTLLGISHGHAVMLCLPEVWEYMEENFDACIDKRGQKYLRKNLNLLANCLKQDTPKNAILFLKKLRSRLGLGLIEKVDEKQFALIVDSVNMERLRNFPIAMTKEDLSMLYRKILMGD